jgi:hypothetical protein
MCPVRSVTYVSGRSGNDTQGSNCAKGLLLAGTRYHRECFVDVRAIISSIAIS